MNDNGQVGFDEMPLGAETRDVLREIGYTAPTPIQAAFVPKALESKDIIGQAQTGTGKTAAFMIPIREGIGEAHNPQALILESLARPFLRGELRRGPSAAV